MKKIYAFAFTLLCSFMAYAEGPDISAAEDNDGKITGTVIDSTSQKPVEFATIALMEGTSEQPINGAVADEKGTFVIKDIKPGDYRVVVSFIGYEPKTIAIKIPERNNHIELGRIIISVTAEILKEVTVEAQKAIIEEKVDRTIYNAENDATSKGGDASDVLRRVPMLTVDLDGNVSLRGNQNIQVLINNKPSTIMAANINDALKQIPADQIKTVEVITSPSARYDAEGSAGIINIITKKNNIEGLTLNVDAGLGYRGSNLGLNGNYRRKKMGFSLGGWGRANYNVTGNFKNETITTTRNIQSADTENRGLFGNYTLGWDYDVNEKNFFTSSVRFGLRSFNRDQDNFLTEIFNSDGSLYSSSLSRVRNEDESNSIDASLTFTHLYEKQGKELSFQGQYSRNNNNSYFLNDFLSGTTEGRDTENENESHNQEMTLQADFVSPIGTNQIFEIGGKNIVRKVVSDVVGGNIRASNLNYDQNVTSGYLSYTYNFTSGISIKGGSRYEYTIIDAYTQNPEEGQQDVDIPSYGVFVPSLNVSKRFKNGKTVKASYNRRIQRPSIRYLNPNRQFQNNVNYTIGNPSLDPEYTNNFELGYSTFIKGTSLNFTAFARNTDDAIQSLRDIIPSGIGDVPDTIRTTFANIGLENAYGASVFANVNIGKLTLNGGGDVYYSILDNNSPLEQYRAKNEGWVISGRMFGSYNLNKGWAVQFFGFGRGRNVQLQGYQGNFRMYSVGLRKEFNEKRGSVGFGLENFLQKSIKIKSETVSPQVTQYGLNTMNNFSFRVNFSYRIGKMSVDQRPNRRRSINNDDLKEGGDGGGMDAGGGGQNMGGGGQRPAGAPAGQRPASVPNEKMAKADSAAVVDAQGTWAYTIESPQGGAGNIILAKENDQYTGTISTNRSPDPIPLKDVKLVGNELSFGYEVSFGGNSMTVNVKGTINGDDLNGNISIGQFGTFPINGKRAQ